MNTETDIKTPSNMYNAATQHNQLIHEIFSTSENVHIIKEAFKTGRAKDLDDEPKKKLEPCFIIGSGPSLDDALPYLKNWKHGIICSTSHALTLMYHGIEPDYIVILDPFCTWSEIEGVDWSKTKTKIVTQPGAWPDLIEKWPNEMLLYIQNIGRESFYTGTQLWMFAKREGFREAKFTPEIKTMVQPYIAHPSPALESLQPQIKTIVTQFACSPPCQLFVAERLGYGRMFLSGVDFGYHSGKDRFTNYTVTKPEQVYQPGNAEPVVIPAEWEKHEHPLIPTDKMVTCSNGLLSEQIHVYYKKNTLSAICLSRRDVISTDHGIITELPYVDIKTVVEKQGHDIKIPPRKQTIKKVENYLAQVGAYVTRFRTRQGEQSMRFIETDHLIDLEIDMKMVLRRYVCETCHSTLMANVDADQTGEECPQCKQGKLVHEVSCDVNANMRRLIGYAKKYHPELLDENVTMPDQNGQPVNVNTKEYLTKQGYIDVPPTVIIDDGYKPTDKEVAENMKAILSEEIKKPAE